MDDLIVEFLTETNESLGDLDVSLVKLEQNPNDKELLSEIFRVMHTIKGTSGFLNLPRLGSVAHKAEDLLGLFRDGKLQPIPSYISLILEAIDRIKDLIAVIETSGSEPEGDDSDLINRLAAACEGEEIEAATPGASAPVPEEGGDVPAEAAGETTAEVAAAPAPAEGVAPATSNETPLSAQSLRVNVDVLEGLMTLVSELVLARNQILQVVRAQKGNGMSGPLQRLSHIVSDLQEGVMKTRMQPVGNAWSKLPRIIRDISTDLGKKIELEMTGQDTELDRQVLEMIKDPLTHMVRNSADHGIEMPEDRLAAGKPEAGHIRLNAYHEGGYILIKISDDGRGLSLAKIKDKIIKNGLASEEELAAMPEQQIQQFIFSAGFSTAEQVTSVSGRGVGMDVVRTNIEKIGGAIEMESVEGQGTCFTIKIPLTLAIISSLIVGVDHARFAIPQLDVGELVMTKSDGPNRIEEINGTPVFRLRGKILPLVCLRELLGFPKQDEGEKLRYIAVVDSGSFSFGIIVDRIYDTEEIVVKPLTSLLNTQTVFSGSTILGDGEVIMILDSSGILRTANIAINAAMKKEMESQDAAEDDHAKTEVPLLLFSVGDNDLKAVPLEHVVRLEEVDLADIETAGGRYVIQYGDSLMPIHCFNDLKTMPSSGRRPVIVFKTKEGLSGLLVERIMDITSHFGEYQIKSEGALEGSAIVKGRAIDIVNLSFERAANPLTNGNGSDNGHGAYAHFPDLDLQQYHGAAK